MSIASYTSANTYSICLNRYGFMLATTKSIKTEFRKRGSVGGWTGDTFPIYVRAVSPFALETIIIIIFGVFGRVGSLGHFATTC